MFLKTQVDVETQADLGTEKAEIVRLRQLKEEVEIENADLYEKIADMTAEFKN
jgi:hypothetical protein